jgi:hypothetical protein
MRLDVDASCNENGPNLSSNLTSCFLVPTIIKWSKLVTMEAQKFLDFDALICFIEKEMVQYYKLVLVENRIGQC